MRDSRMRRVKDSRMRRVKNSRSESRRMVRGVIERVSESG